MTFDVLYIYILCLITRSVDDADSFYPDNSCIYKVTLHTAYCNMNKLNIKQYSNETETHECFMSMKADESKTK